jgi:hypothetical protein
MRSFAHASHLIRFESAAVISNHSDLEEPIPIV